MHPAYSTVNTIKHLSFSLCLTVLLLFSGTASASAYLWLRPEHQTTLSSGNAACELTLIQNDIPQKLNEKNIIAAVYHCHSLKGAKKEFTVPLTIKQYGDRTSFAVESPFVSLCETQVIVKYDDVIYSLQCNIPLFGNGDDKNIPKTMTIPEMKQIPRLQLLKNNLPYYFPATGEKLSFNYTSPFALQNKIPPIIILPDKSEKEPLIETDGNFSYTYPAVPPLAMVADTSIKQLIIVQPDTTPDGQKYCTSLTICLAEPYLRYLAVKEGWLLFSAALIITSIIACRILRRPYHHADK